MSDLNCNSKYCFNYGPGIFYCNCKIADRRKSAAFIQECRANRKLQEDIEMLKDGNNEEKHE